MNTEGLLNIAIIKRMKLQNIVGKKIKTLDKVADKESRLIPKEIKETIHFFKNPNHINTTF